MQITSTFVLAAVLALKATSIAALPFASESEIMSMDARELASYEAELEARSFYDELEFDAREFDDEFELEARDFDDFEEFEARTVTTPTHTSHFQTKISNEQQIMNKEASSIKAQEQRLKTQQKDVGLQEQIHKDRVALRKDNAFGTHNSGRVSTSSRSSRTTSTTPKRPASRFQSKIGHEQRVMDKEAKRIKAQEQRLHKQQKQVGLQQQIHKDRVALRKDNAFGGRQSNNRISNRPGSTTGRPTTSRFQSKINNEQHIMDKESQRIKAEEARLKTQQKDMSLQEQIHKDRAALRNDNAFN